MPLLPDNQRRYLFIVLMAATLFRGGFLLWSWSDSPFFASQSVLSRNYFKEGYAVAAGYGYVVGASARGEATLEALYRRVTFENFAASPRTADSLSEHDFQPKTLHPPGMAFVIAAVHRASGLPADVPLQLLAVTLDVAAAGLFWWIVTAYLGPRIGLVAGLLYALFPPFAAYAVSKESDGMLGFFVVSSLAATLKAADRWGSRALFWTILAGLFVGVGAYLRPDYLLVPVIMAAGLWAYTRRLLRSVATAAAIQLTALVLLVPWAVRNHAVCDRWIFTSTSVGGTLVTGLGEFHNPWGLRALDEDRTREAKAQGISSPWSCEGDRYFRSVFFDNVREHPGAYAMTIVKRMPMALATPFDFSFQNPWKTVTFSEARIGGEDHYQVLLRRPGYVVAAYWDPLLMAGFTLACLLATLVMAFMERHRVGLLLLLLSPHLYSIGTHMLTHLEPRYLLPSMFCWFIGPAYLLARLTILSAKETIRLRAGSAMLRSGQVGGS